VSDRDRDQHPDDDWGSPTDWQQPAHGSGPGGSAPPPPQYQAPPPQYQAPPPQYQAPPPHYQPAPPHAPPWSAGPWSPPPPTYMVPAILVTLFCFLPTGIAAIYFASQVSSRFGAGDPAGARQASDKAKMWTFISLGIGLVVGLFVLFASGSGTTT
jgi:interferon-induced transmembrane protein